MRDTSAPRWKPVFGMRRGGSAHLFEAADRGEIPARLDGGLQEAEPYSSTLDALSVKPQPNPWILIKE